MDDDPDGGGIVTIKEFFDQLNSDPDLMNEFLANREAVCRAAGLNDRQCRVIASGDFQKIQHAIELESDIEAGDSIHIVM